MSAPDANDDSDSSSSATASEIDLRDVLPIFTVTSDSSVPELPRGRNLPMTLLPNRSRSSVSGGSRRGTEGRPAAQTDNAPAEGSIGGATSDSSGLELPRGRNLPLTRQPNHFSSSVISGSRRGTEGTPAARTDNAPAEDSIGGGSVNVRKVSQHGRAHSTGRAAPRQVIPALPVPVRTTGVRNASAGQGAGRGFLPPSSRSLPPVIAVVPATSRLSTSSASPTAAAPDSNSSRVLPAAAVAVTAAVGPPILGPHDLNENAAAIPRAPTRHCTYYPQYKSFFRLWSRER